MKKVKWKQKKVFMTLVLVMVLMLVGTGVNPQTVKASSRTFRTNGKTYRVKSDWNNTSLYRKDGNKYKKVASTKKYLTYAFSYKNKLYFSGGVGGGSGFTYAYTTGKKGFKKVASAQLTSHKGKYAVGYSMSSEGLNPSYLCIYNLSSGKKIKKLGSGYDIKFIGNKIYYASWKNSHTVQIIRRNANGGGKKILKTIRASGSNIISNVRDITKHSATYTVMGGTWVIKKARF